MLLIVYYLLILHIKLCMRPYGTIKVHTVNHIYHSDAIYNWPIHPSTFCSPSYILSRFTLKLCCIFSISLDSSSCCRTLYYIGTLVYKVNGKKKFKIILSLLPHASEFKLFSDYIVQLQTTTLLSNNIEMPYSFCCSCDGCAPNTIPPLPIKCNLR